MSLYEASLTEAKKAAREFIRQADGIEAGDATRGHLDVLAGTVRALLGDIRDQQSRNNAPPPAPPVPDDDA